MNYYRAINNIHYKGCGLLKPYPISHEMDRNGKLVYQVYDNEPFFTMSREPILCFSKTISGAITGAITGERGFNYGIFYICKTTQKPDVDLSNRHIGDFADIKEVRYKRPVQTTFVKKVNISRVLSNKVETLYEKGYYPQAVKLVKENIK